MLLSSGILGLSAPASPASRDKATTHRTSARVDGSRATGWAHATAGSRPTTVTSFFNIGQGYGLWPVSAMGGKQTFGCSSECVQPTLTG